MIPVANRDENYGGRVFSCRDLNAAGIAAAGDDAEVGARLPECLLIDVGLSGRLLDDARLLGATSELLAQELLRALAAADKSRPAQQSARRSKFSKLVDGGRALPLRESNNPFVSICAGRKESPKDYATLFLVRIRADVCPELVDLGVREYVLPRRHLVPAVAHRGAELRAIVGCQSAQVRKLTRAHQPVPVTHCAIVVVDGLAGLKLCLIGHNFLRARRRG